MKTGDLFYSSFGRIVHSYWLLHDAGARITDDFGNSVRVKNAPIVAYIRQAH